MKYVMSPPRGVCYCESSRGRSFNFKLNLYSMILLQQKKSHNRLAVETGSRVITLITLNSTV